MAKWIDRNALGPKGALQLWVEGQVLGFRDLCGHSVACWVGTEMAFRETGPSGAPLFRDPTIPCLQVCNLYLGFADGAGRDIHTYQNLWPDGWGLCIDTLCGRLPDETADLGSIWRTRTLQELPLGMIENVHVVQNSDEDIVKVRLQVSSAYISLCSGEVYEEADGALRIVRPDESVLVSVTRK